MSYYKYARSATEFCFEVADLNSASRTAKLRTSAQTHLCLRCWVAQFASPVQNAEFNHSIFITLVLNIFHRLAHRSRQIAHTGFDGLRWLNYLTCSTKPHTMRFCALLREPALASPLFSCFLPLNLLSLVATQRFHLFAINLLTICFKTAHNAFLRVTARVCFCSTTLFLLLAS